MPEPIPRLTLELLALGELDDEQQRQLRAKLAEDSDLAERFARIEREIAAARPLPELAIEGWSEPQAAGPSSAFSQRNWPKWASLAAISALAVAAAALLWPRPQPEVRFRGSLELEVLRIRQGLASPAGEQLAAREGDRLQYTVTVPEAGFVSVLDLQDDGEVSLWKDAEPVDAGGSVQGAVILDDYPGQERVFFLWAAVPLAGSRLEAVARDAAGTPLLELDRLPGLQEVTQRSILLLEEP